MKIVSLITARGGSKGVPLKNIIDINGKPLIWYSINASLNSNVSETWVSTEDLKIKTVSIECGAKVIDRPKELANDIIMPDASILHFAENIDFDLVVFIQPTSPMIKPEYINEGIDKIIKKGYDSTFAVVREHWLAAWDLNLNPIGWDINDRHRRQDKPDIYREIGMFYITKREYLLKSKLRYSGKIGPVEIPVKDSIDVNTMDDVDLLRELL